MVHLEANDGAAAFYLLFVLAIFITCLTPVIVARLLKGMHMPQNIQYQKNQKTQYNKGTFLLAATVVGAGAVCWSIHPTAVEWANASATFEPHEILGVAWDVSERALRSAYRRLALEHHPDQGGCEETMARLNHARDVLCDAAARRNHDRELDGL